MRKIVVPVFVLSVVSLSAGAARLFGPVRLSAPSGAMDLRAGGFKAGYAAPRPSVAAPGDKGSPAAKPEKKHEEKKVERPVEEKLPPPVVSAPSPRAGVPAGEIEKIKAEKPVEIKLGAPSVVSRSKSDVSVAFPPGDDSAGVDAAAKLVLARVEGMDGYSLRLVSYYGGDGRNVAFSRLLNIRKALLDGGMAASRMMILVEEDDRKNGTVEITVLK